MFCSTRLAVLRSLTVGALRGHACEKYTLYMPLLSHAEQVKMLFGQYTIVPKLLPESRGNNIVTPTSYCTVQPSTWEITRFFADPGKGRLIFGFDHSVGQPRGLYARQKHLSTKGMRRWRPQVFIRSARYGDRDLIFLSPDRGKQAARPRLRTSTMP